MIRIKDFSKTFKKFNFSIECNSLSVDKGEILGIHGDIGSGKTLFTKLLAGIYKNYKGSIELSLTERHRVSKGIYGFVPSDNILYNNMSIKDHGLFFLTNYKINAKKLDSRVLWFSQFFNISDILDKKIYSLTSGELQFVKLFLGTIHSPSVLIIDELFTGLGDKSIEVLKTLLDDLLVKEVSILFTTSHENYISSITSSKMSIDDGVIS